MIKVPWTYCTINQADDDDTSNLVKGLSDMSYVSLVADSPYCRIFHSCAGCNQKKDYGVFKPESFHMEMKNGIVSSHQKRKRYWESKKCNDSR